MFRLSFTLGEVLLVLCRGWWSELWIMVAKLLVLEEGWASEFKSVVIDISLVCKGLLMVWWSRRCLRMATEC